jgi:hypothetical protein
MGKPLTIAFHQSEPQSAQKDQIIARLPADSVVVRVNDLAHSIGQVSITCADVYTKRAAQISIKVKSDQKIKAWEMFF